MQGALDSLLQQSPQYEIDYQLLAHGFFAHGFFAQGFFIAQGLHGFFIAQGFLPAQGLQGFIDALPPMLEHPTINAATAAIATLPILFFIAILPEM